MTTIYLPYASWDCGMPDGIPAPETGKLAFTAELHVRELLDLGATPFGRRQIIVTEGGSLQGPALEATFLEGGLDWELTLPHGVVELEQAHCIQVDGGLIYFRSRGVAPSMDE